MNATAIPNKGAASFEELKPVCQILILHEDFSAYTCAVKVCRKVMERFADELDFDIKCWNFIELADPNCGRHAAKSAGGADIVIFSVHRPALPVEVERWLDSFFVARFRSDGALLFVLNSPGGSDVALEKCISRLETSARRLDMEFIPVLAHEDKELMGLQPVAAALRATRV